MPFDTGIVTKHYVDHVRTSTSTNADTNHYCDYGNSTHYDDNTTYSLYGDGTIHPAAEPLSKKDMDDLLKYFQERYTKPSELQKLEQELKELPKLEYRDV